VPPSGMRPSSTTTKPDGSCVACSRRVRCFTAFVTASSLFSTTGMHRSSLGPFSRSSPPAERGSLDGTLIAALASRHRLLGCRRVDQRLLLLRVLIWFDDNHRRCNLATFLDEVAAWLRHSVEGGPLPSGSGEPPSATALDDLVNMLDPVLDGQVSLPTHLPAWVPATEVGRKRVLKRYIQAQQRLSQRLLPYQQKKKLSKKDKEAVKRLRTSLSDPEAALGWDKVGTYRPVYNLLLVQATDAPLTLAWEVLGCNNDQGHI